MTAKNAVVALIASPTERLVLQVPRALVASALAAAVDFAVLVLLVEGAGWGAVPAAVAGYLAGGVLQYVLCAVWVFPAAPQNATLGFTAFLILSLGGLGITWLCMEVIHEWAGINYALAKVVALGLAFWWNFLSRRYWLFRG